MTEAAYTVTYLEVAPNAAENVAGLLAQLALAAQSVDGNRRFEVYRRLSPSHHFALLAEWDSRGAYDTARTGLAGDTLRGWKDQDQQTISDYAKSLWSSGVAYDLAGDRESAIAAFQDGLRDVGHGAHIVSNQILCFFRLTHAATRSAPHRFALFVIGEKTRLADAVPFGSAFARKRVDAIHVVV